MPPPWKCLKALLHLGLKAIGGGDVFLEIFFYINVDNKNPFVEKGNHLIIWRKGECHKAECFIGGEDTIPYFSMENRYAFI